MEKFMTKKLCLIAFCAVFSMFFVISCGSDEEEDAVNTETGDRQSDTGTTDPTDTTDTTDATDATDPTNSEDQTNPTDDPTNPADEPTEEPTNPTDEPTNPTDPTDPTNPGEGDDSDPSGNQAQDGAVGAACTRDEDCSGTYSGTYGGESYEQVPVCLTQSGDGFPGGYCSFMCDSTDHQACDKAGGVYHGYNGWGDGFCYNRCTQASDCREGYICSEKVHACMPDCSVNDCVIGNCDETEKVCL